MEGENGIPPKLEEVKGFTFCKWDYYSLYTNVRESSKIDANYYTGTYKTHKVEFLDYDGKILGNPTYIIPQP